jgi:EAL domain-containing protein (putative c-di-GMP-specific phosphodiesterase class I)
MNYLRRFPFDGIKIDKSFIRGICSDEVTLAIVQAILSLAARLKLVVVAEGVETERELNVLRKLDCRFIQGYLTGRATDNQQANALLRQSWAGDAGSGFAATGEWKQDQRDSPLIQASLPG